MPAVLAELSSSEYSNRRNAAYLGGLLCQHGSAVAVNHYPKFLMALHPLFSPSETNDGVRDNAAGAVARMIAARPEAVPLAQVLPVLLSSLPLKEDMEEAEAVYGCLANLVLGPYPEVFPYRAQIMALFEAVAGDENVPQTTRNGAASAASQIKTLI